MKPFRTVGAQRVVLIHCKLLGPLSRAAKGSRTVRRRQPRRHDASPAGAMADQGIALH